MLIVCWCWFSQTVVSCRNQPVKKLTMGYITNYSYCTAMVSSSVILCKHVQIYQTLALNVCIKKNLITIMASQNIIKINLLFWLIITELFMVTRYLTFFVGLFVFVFIAYNSSKLTSVLGFLSPGVRTEQDLYIRLIDSMTKQVSCCYTSVSTHGATQCSHPWSPCAKP